MGILRRVSLPNNRFDCSASNCSTNWTASARLSPSETYLNSKHTGNSFSSTRCHNFMAKPPPWMIGALYSFHSVLAKCCVNAVLNESLAKYMNFVDSMECCSWANELVSITKLPMRWVCKNCSSSSKNCCIWSGTSGDLSWKHANFFDSEMNSSHAVVMLFAASLSHVLWSNARGPIMGMIADCKWERGMLNFIFLLWNGLASSIIEWLNSHAKRLLPWSSLATIWLDRCLVGQHYQRIHSVWSQCIRPNLIRHWDGFGSKPTMTNSEK